MTRSSAAWKDRLNLSQYLLACAAISLIVAIFFGRSFSAAPRLDEMMLFSNYPLSNPRLALEPLPLYDQAATPLYSLLLGWTGLLDSTLTRATHFFVIFCSALVILSWNKRSTQSILIAAATLTALRPPIDYMIEMKHYGLESIGTLAITSWFIYKRVNSPFTIRDVAYLLFCTLLGFSTLPVAAITVFTFAVMKLLSRTQIRAQELACLTTLGGLFAIYYYLIKKITIYQILNYPGPYQTLGLSENIKMFVAVFMKMLPAGILGTGVTLLALILLLINPRDRGIHRKLVFISAFVFFSFMMLSGLNLYPIKYVRHLIWTAGLLWLILYHVSSLLFDQYFAGLNSSLTALSPADLRLELQRIVDQRLLQITTSIVVFFYGLFTAINLTRFTLQAPQSDSREAISFILENPGIDVGLFGGAQTIISYYSRFYPELRSRAFFGKLRSESTRALPNNPLEIEKLSMDPDKPGSYARFWQKNVDTSEQLRHLLNLAPRNTPFLLFTYWTDGFANIKDNSIDKSNCRSIGVADFNSAKIFKMICKNRQPAT